jgi:SHS2 domain-containing protein
MHELFEHTADLGLRAAAADMDGLFSEAAMALLSAIVEEPVSVRPVIEARIEIAGADREYLLADWLKELLFRFEDEQMLFCRFEVQTRSNGLSAVIWGEPFDPERHLLSHEVKAITYHELKVVQTKDGWLAEVIVDI